MTQTSTERPPSPAPVVGRGLPEVPGPGETLTRAWKGLRKMSTAIKLLLGLVVMVVLGTFVPQEPVIPLTVERWRTGVEGPGERTSQVFDWLGLYDVFGAWWFNALVVLLIVSLTGCLIPRIAGFVRLARKPPAAGRNLRRLTHHVEFATNLGPDEALDAVTPALARRRFRRRRLGGEETRSGHPQLAAERGHSREGGSIAFHLSFYVLLIGAVMGHTLGFEGQVNVVEGASFADTRISYPLAAPGRWFPDDGHRGFEVRLDAFTVDYLELEPDEEITAQGDADLVTGGAFSSFLPAEFRSHLTILEDGQEVRDGDVQVNHPFVHDDVRIYQIRFGMAPRLRVETSDGVALFDESVILSEAGGGFIWQGVAPIVREDVDNQIAVEAVLLPDAAFDAQGMPVSRSPEPRNPRLALIVWVGALGLERNVPATQFLRDQGRQLEQPVILAPGETGAVEGLPLEITFADLPYWSGFQVSQERGRGVLLAGAGLMLVGLLPSLYGYRRRVWVEASGEGEGARVVLAGVALQRKGVFADAFDSLTDDVRTRLDLHLEAHDVRDAADERSAPVARADRRKSLR